MTEGKKILTTLTLKIFIFSARSTMGQIYHDLENIRPQLFRLTAETEDDNDELMLILRLTDEVTRIINTCKEKYPQVIARYTAFLHF